MTTVEELHKRFLEYPLVSTDSRKIEADCIFFALKGPNFDGNTFAREALEKGAAFVVIDNPDYHWEGKTLLVKDVLTALQELARYHRHYCNARVIALTGSNGKTTTKELIYSVLSGKYRTIATKGNLNNHIGVPLTLLSIQADTEFAIIEMGANHQKEIAFLSNIAEPDFGYITNFGKAHLEGFGGVEGVIKGKSELYDFLTANNKHAFLNADDPIQVEKLSGYVRKIGFSQTDPQYFNIRFLRADPFVWLEIEDTVIKTQLIGEYNFSNCCVALLIGKYFNVPLESMKEGIENYVPENNRSQVLHHKHFKIIMDAYNANPSSMKVALEQFGKMKEDPKIAFLGDMFELGEDAEREHQQIAELAASLNLEEVFLVGENFYRTQTELQKFPSFDSLSSHLKTSPLSSGTLLIKGSRGMALERLLEVL
ncbi:UDP-N-acetylmuramoyl-tripeptide--D-alanyl-D-alanine ligase [Poritiphilus flavus]|uniref:UDP-N-acetylmuramoyl-tripeptide--D-alanyl-D-alanine ligase n=1 Tax=Poritiphilus flavus TaxID=2697053 RepID=A0A6L9EHF3_9FLAO|nr:UDP-N-acetylmuramoyl-tripeptide--D-alanyl-D-alanine ligase [Poritiphilus flavus]NAS14141.1 UDP-N-acetylmuramoyl-tripeptide--D-alanyl-D-alanine ligase [Poritiphilus flavus]